VNEGPVTLEEILIREAVSRIRKWLQEKGQGKENISLPRVGIKFCGGCNPVIERGLVAQRIRRELEEEARWVSEEEEPDFLLIVNGCRTACADTSEVRSGRPVVVVAGESVSA
jgi:hypothetical protein